MISCGLKSAVSLYFTLAVATTTVLAIINLAFEHASREQQEGDRVKSGQRIAALGFKEPRFTGRYLNGPEKALIRIVFFGDYACPICLQIDSQITTLLRTQTNISFSFKHYPLSAACNKSLHAKSLDLHPNSCQAAWAAETAGILAGDATFFAMHEWLIKREGKFKEAELFQFVDSLGLSTDLFRRTMVSHEVRQRILEDVDEAERLGILSTPMVFVNGIELKGIARLMAIQHAYVDKVLAETAEFGNIIYEIANETGGARWVAHFTDYIHKHSKHPQQLVSAGEQSTSFNPCTGANDIVVKHRGGGGLYATDTDIGNHHRALLRFHVGKPVTHNEYFLFANRSTDDIDFPRKMMWGDFTSGGHSNFFDFTFWRGTGKILNDGLPSRSPPPEILGAGKHLLEFLTENNMKFWTMVPHDELAAVKGKNKAHVFTLARPGHTYICYALGDGQVRLTLRLVDGPFIAGWHVPKCGEFVTPAQHVHGREKCLFHSPVFDRDIVLFVRRPPSL